MAYEKHEWKCGETITAELLNNIEEGIEEALACCRGGTDYSADCERTDLGTLVACGSLYDPDFESSIDAEAMIPLSSHTITAIVNGVEAVGKAEDDYSVVFGGDCISWSISVEDHGGVPTIALGELAGNPGTICGREIEYAIDRHVALYSKAN